ncbi:MAG: hypothetical protein ACREXT_12720 [Gammaproteobacteria bacterium]
MTQPPLFNASDPLGWLKQYGATLAYEVRRNRWRIGVLVRLSPHVMRYVEAYGSTPEAAIAAAEIRMEELEGIAE